MELTTTQHEKTIAELYERLAQHENALEQYVATITTQEATITNQENRITTQENRITTQEAKITTQETTITTQETTITTQETTITTQEATITTHIETITTLNERIQQLLQEQYGKRSEKFNEPQAESAFDEALVNPDEQQPIEEADADITLATPAQKKHGGGRKPLPAHLPREEILYPLSDDEKQCACGCTLTKIGDERSEQLDIIPAQIKVLVHVREKWACKGCQDTLKTAPLPKHPIPKSMASPGLLAHILVCKYEDHLPLYRQENILQRIGIDIPRSTLSHWMIKCGKVLTPLVTLMHTIIRRHDIAYADETPVQVLNEESRAAEKKSFMWYFSGGSLEQRCVIYEYHPTRSGDVARDFFTGFNGYLHCDGYSGYEKLFSTQPVAHVACWAHARRKFMEIVKSSKNPSSVARGLLGLIKKLYKLEKQYKAQGLSSAEVYTQRQEKAKPILFKIKKMLDDNISKAPPQSAIAKAMNYALNQWEALMIYITDGRLEIDNNASERGIKTFVIGRKNWLFFDRPEGATAGAVIYSLIQTCKLHDVEPYAYFRHVLAALPYTTTDEQRIALLPFNYVNHEPFSAA